jgi:protein-tyrosine phosphatase/nicotinamidase-related amidase
MNSILITQCLQNDFVAPIAPHEPLPNALHVGRAEALRLVGDDAATGPLGQLTHWAREQPVDRLHVVHVRDWHDAGDPAQKNHLARFGLHCLQDTEGARLVYGEEGVAGRANETFVDSITLNDFEGGTNLREVLDDICGGQPVRVGVVGVWTEAKVTFLLYDLLTRCGITDLATCSALTASASRTQHFNALEQLRKVLGVDVFDSIGDFTDWLVPDGEPISPPLPEPGMRPEVQITDETPLSDRDSDVLAYLYRDSSRVHLNPLGGGFSGAAVFQVHSRDALGHEQAASVLKLGPRELIASERVAFERVESILGNDAPSIRGFADFGERAGIKYAYAAMGNGEGVRTFKDLYESGAPFARVEAVLRHVFDEILGRFYSVAYYERLPLLDYYTFDSKYADGVREWVREIVGDAADAPRIEVAGHEVQNPAAFYATHLEAMPRSLGEYHFVSYVHGDLNGANILLDGRENVWLIDFFHAHRGHILKDLAKLENDLLYIFTPVDDEEALAEALLITEALRRVKDLRAPLPESVPGLTSPCLVRAWKTIRLLRSFGAKLCREDRDPMQMSVALLRYAVHTLSFDESDALQKKWALAAAGAHADDVVRTARENRDLRVDWVDGGPGPGRIGLTICPGRRDRGRDLGADLASMVADGASDLICLLTREEMEWAGVTDLADRAAGHGLSFRHVPILDQGVPTMETMRDLVGAIEASLDDGGRVVLHCMGGLGRSGTVGACVLRSAGLDADAAIGAIRDARGPRAVETRAQEAFVRSF